MAGGGAGAPVRHASQHALDMPRTCESRPELYLEAAAIVGGLERVFEINRNFRNEGFSQHNLEFTMMGVLRQAYSDYLRR